MSPQARWEYMKSVHRRYRQARTKKAKGVILDEFCKTYDCHRKHALRVLNAGNPPDRRPARRPRRSPYKDPRLQRVLEGVWAATGHLCGRRLKAALPHWLPWIRRRLSPEPEVVRLLLAMSAPTIDRHLRPGKDAVRRKIYGTTRAGLLLKHHIPIKTDNWDVDRPGFMEVDLVSHSGDCAKGDFAHTLNMTDIHTGWVERRCVLGKGQRGVLEAIADVRRALPFPLLGIDSDNGSEFINGHLLAYCREEPAVQFTRGRPYKKDDNAHIEQKNWTHVRKLVGYARYDRPQAVALLNRLYRRELRWFQNLFLPSMKLVSKERVGSKLRRRYDEPKTPLARLIQSGALPAARVATLRRNLAQLDPFELSAAVDRALDRVWSMRSKAPQPRWPHRGRIPDYENKVIAGPPLLPVPLPGIERFEKILNRELTSQTWT